MKNEKIDLEAEFRKDFQNLLDKYGAEIEVRDDYSGYPECGQELVMEVYIPAIWGENYGELIQKDYIFNLGTYNCANKIN